jgi:hypothetical protein
MLSTRLILCQSFPIIMIAHKRILKPFTFFNGRRDRWTTDDEMAVSYAREEFQCFELADECRFVLGCDGGEEFKKDCR